MKRSFFLVLLILIALLFSFVPDSLLAFQEGRRGSDDGTVAVTAEEVADAPKLSNDQHVAIQTFEDEDLASVVAIDGSRDGRFLYTAAFAGKAICSIQVDSETGKLSNKKVQSLIPGAIGLHVSPDQKWLIAVAHTMNAIVLFSRDAESGDLELVDNYMIEEAGPNGSILPIAVTFSPNSKFVYASDDSGVLHCLKRTDDSLEYLSAETGEDECLFGARNVTFDATGKYLSVVCRTANTFVVFKHNPEDGSLSLVDYAEDEVGGITALAGAHGLNECPDSKHMYVCCGRFSGDSSVMAFELAEDGKLKLLQELEAGEQLDGFEGGNLINASPDGKFVYASGALSGNLASFKRDAASGKLTFDRYFEVDGDEDLQMTSGIHISGDNRFVYVGGEAAGCVYVFERQPTP